MSIHFSFRSMTESDWPSVADIFRQGIETGNATFETDVPSWESWNKSHLKTCRLVAVIDNEIAGWAALSPVSGRCVYAGVAEVSIYISNRYKNRHIGTSLLKRLVEESEKEGFWTLQAGIFPENAASIRIHEKNGFRKVGSRERIGKMNGVWRDIILLELRSIKDIN